MQMVVPALGKSLSKALSPNASTGSKKIIGTNAGSFVI